MFREETDDFRFCTAPRRGASRVFEEGGSEREHVMCGRANTNTGFGCKTYIYILQEELDLLVKVQ